MTHIRNTTMRSFLRTMTHYRIEKWDIFERFVYNKECFTFKMPHIGWHFELYRAIRRVIYKDWDGFTEELGSHFEIFFPNSVLFVSTIR